jgi:hypothetical protein
MRKLKLDLDALEVQSFHAGSAAAAAGTVKAHATPTQFFCTQQYRLCHFLRGHGVPGAVPRHRLHQRPHAVRRLPGHRHLRVSGPTAPLRPRVRGRPPTPRSRIRALPLGPQG